MKKNKNKMVRAYKRNKPVKKFRLLDGEFCLRSAKRRSGTNTELHEKSLIRGEKKEQQDKRFPSIVKEKKSLDSENIEPQSNFIKKQENALCKQIEPQQNVDFKSNLSSKDTSITSAKMSIPCVNTFENQNSVLKGSNNKLPFKNPIKRKRKHLSHKTYEKRYRSKPFEIKRTCYHEEENALSVSGSPPFKSIQNETRKREALRNKNCDLKEEAMNGVCTKTNQKDSQETTKNQNNDIKDNSSQTENKPIINSQTASDDLINTVNLKETVKLITEKKSPIAAIGNIFQEIDQEISNTDFSLDPPPPSPPSSLLPLNPSPPPPQPLPSPPPQTLSPKIPKTPLCQAKTSKSPHHLSTEEPKKEEEVLLQNNSEEEEESGSGGTEEIEELRVTGGEGRGDGGFCKGSGGDQEEKGLEEGEGDEEKREEGEEEGREDCKEELPLEMTFIDIRGKFTNPFIEPPLVQRDNHLENDLKSPPIKSITAENFYKFPPGLGILQIPSKGFYNFGNDCFANASFQLLFSVAPLIRSSLDVHSSGSFASASYGEVTSKFVRLVNAYCNSKTRVMRDRACRECFSSQFTLNWQHDASLFISTLLEKIQQEHDKSDSILSFSEHNTWQSAWEFYKGQRTSIVDELFTGFYQNTFRCEHCSAEIKNYEEFKNIPVYFDEDQNDDYKINFQKLFYSIESSKFFCYSCEEKRTCTIRNQVVVSPEYLLLPIQRMNSATMQKRHDFMEYEEDVRICTSEEGEQIYSLISVICHYGSIEFGHYTAYCKRQGTWKYFNDTKVYKRCRSYITEDAYILLYQRQNPPKNSQK
ncbi:unnamed protein product [Moneuplotes crassus]|uniref:Ubiquitin carboxyl-terminal hydrolase n=1 Tax=Euplotes crassus TaxID=5936 RepID=A0AAD1Y7M9_EUPCR|nr:unnamed protein product [Moneuplotes crassus]